MQTEYSHNTPWQHSQPYPGMPPHPPTTEPGVVWRQLVANDRSGLKLLGSSIIFLAFLFGLIPLSSFTEMPLPSFARVGYLILGLLVPGFLLLYGLSMFIQARRWEVINQRRQQAAVYGLAAGVPRVEPHPVASSEPLSLPWTITLKHRVAPSIGLFCWLSTSVCCYLAFFLAFFYRDSFALLGAASLPAIIIRFLHHWVFFLFLPLLFVAACRTCLASPQTIEVTAQGLLVRDILIDWFKTSSGAYREGMIPWQDVHLFALRTGKPGTATISYELASPVGVVSFARIVRPRWWLLYWPAQPLGEYNAQMDALLALISAKTGLLLYDVR